MKKLVAIVTTAILLTGYSAMAEEPVKEPSLVQQIADLTNQLNTAQGQVKEAQLETARMQARYLNVVRLYNAKAKKYKFAPIKG